MNRQELMTLCVAAANNQPSTNFSAEDIQTAARNAIL